MHRLMTRAMAASFHCPSNDRDMFAVDGNHVGKPRGRKERGHAILVSLVEGSID